MQSSLLDRLFDRLSLRPSRNPLPHDLQSSWMDVDGQRCELFRLDVQPTSPSGTDPQSINIIKFIGAAGRAENLTEMVLGGLPHLGGSIWVANPPGYGRSEGRATLPSQLRTAERLYEEITANHGVPYLAGDSLGGAIALCMATRVDSPGLIIRDPPPIRQLITTRFGHFPRVSRFFANMVPEEVDAMLAAPKCQLPALFVSSRKDQIVPISCQDELIAAYGGPMRLVKAHEAKHVAPLTSLEAKEYREALKWLLAAKPSQANPAR